MMRFGMFRRPASLAACSVLMLGAAQAPQLIRVTIDVKPGDTPTTLERSRGGQVPIAVLSTTAFDALDIDVETIRVGPSGEEAEPVRTSASDVNEDRRPDLVVLVRVPDLQLSCTDTTIKLTAKTQGGVPIEGSETITITGCGQP
jgi:hypothetical protein